MKIKKKAQALQVGEKRIDLKEALRNEDIVRQAKESLWNEISELLVEKSN